MTNGYIVVDLSDLILDGVENTGDSKLYAKFTKVLASRKPVVFENITLKKEFTGLAKDIVVDVAYGTITNNDGTYVCTMLLASMNININVESTNKYKGIKF